MVVIVISGFAEGAWSGAMTLGFGLERGGSQAVPQDMMYE